MQNNLAPICLFVYNRIEETKLTISALQANFLANESDLIVFSDGYKDENDAHSVRIVRDFVRNISGFRSVKIIESFNNKGLAKSVIEGVSLVLENSETIIVLEDDLITTPNFLDFMNQALSFYKDNKEVYSVNGYSPDIEIESSDLFKAKRAFPWSWATWRDRWDRNILADNYICKNINKFVLKEFNNECGDDAVNMLKNTLNGRNSSWYIRWVFVNFLEKKVSIFPVKSKVMNIGFTDRGTHCSEISTYKSQLDKTFFREFNFINIEDINLVTNSFLRYFSFSYKLLFRIKMLRSLHGIRLLFKEFKNKRIL